MQSFGTFLRKHIKDKSTWIGYPKLLLAYVEYAWQVYISAVESLSHGPRLVLCFAVVCATLVQRNLSKHSVQRNLSFGTTARNFLAVVPKDKFLRTLCIKFGTKLI
jgi:hypothetical protein